MTASSGYLGSLASVFARGETDDLAMLLDMADRALVDSQSLSRFRSSRGDRAGPGVRAGIWRSLCSLGLVGACAPARVGGSECPISTGILLAECFGRRLAPEPYLAGALLPSLFLAAVQSQEADRLLAEAGSGKALPVVAVQEKPGIDDVGRPETVLTSAPDGLRLKGRKGFVHGAAWATHFIVSATRDGVVCLVLVGRGSSGLNLELRGMADGTVAAELTLTDVVVRPSQVIAQGAPCEAAIAGSLNWGLVAISAELFGLATALFGMTLDYLRTRTQFRRPIGEFQALQHRCADLYCSKEIARFTIAQSMAGLAVGDPAAAAALASRCKARAALAATEMGRAAVQLHGAIGFSDEADVGLYLKRILVLSAWFGNADHHRRRVARLDPYRVE